MTWKEFQLWYRQKPTQSSDQDEIFAFKQNALLPALDALGVTYAFILDEEDYVLVRIETTIEDEPRVKSALEQAILGSPRFSHVNIGPWDPEVDARNRIQKVLAQLPALGFPPSPPGNAWTITGDFPTHTVQGSLKVAPMPLDDKIRESATYMAKVAGEFTLAYLRHMPSRVEDRWLKSLFVHLLLDSISTWQGDEKQIRGFPYI